MATLPTRLTLLLAGFAVFATFSATSAREPVATAKIKTYSPWQAAWDAHARSSRAQLHAIDRQRQANDLMSWYGTYAPGYYRAYYRPRGWGQRSYERRLSKSPVHVPFPSGPGVAYPFGGKVVPTLPYLTPDPAPVEHPVGHKKTWTSHNGYIYEPVYASDTNFRDEPATRPTPYQPPATQPRTAPKPAAPTPAPIIPEAIPTPPALPEVIPTPQPE